MADLFSKFQKVDPQNRNLTADTILSYEEAHMKLVKNYSNEIQTIAGMMEQLRKEREDFYLNKLPEIKSAMVRDEVSTSIQEQWLVELQENMERSFQISESLIQHYVTDNLAEFRKKLQEIADQV